MNPRKSPQDNSQQEPPQTERRPPEESPSPEGGLDRQPSAAGSPGKGEPVFLVVGRLQRPHGLRGEIVMEIFTDFPERLQRGLTVYLGKDYSPRVLKSVRQHADGLLVAFREHADRDAVFELRNENVYVRAEALPPLPEGEYYHHQVLGLRVVNETGEVLGTLAEILETGAHDVYLIRPESGQDILLPVLDSTILEVDLERGEMRVHILPGLLPDEQETEGRDEPKKLK